MITAVLILSLLAQEPVGGPAQAPDGPLHLSGGNADVANWLTQPVEHAPGVWRVWWRSFQHPAAESDGMNRTAFLYEVHCSANELRQVRFELYADGRLLRGSDQNQPLHEPVARWADPEVMAYVCGEARLTVMAPDADAAARHFRAR